MWAAGWVAGANFPSPVVRGVGAFFPTNGKFYVVGGRSSDTAGSDLLNPREYNPATNTWVVKAGTLPDNQVNNMVGATLTGPSGPRIYVVGGSAAGATTATSRVAVYDPVADSVTTLSTDPWPGNAGGNILPGGYAVVNNKLYVLGGFQINVAMTNQIWQFDPMAGAGAKWTLKTAVLPVPEGYVPATNIGGIIYTGGGSTWTGTTLADSTNSYRYDPATDTISSIAPIPRATGETRAVTWLGQMWVLGGGRVTPNPSNQVNIYDPGTNTWSLGPSFTTARRNFPADVDPGVAIFTVGGYDTTGLTPLSVMEIYHPASPCGIVHGHKTWQGISQPNAHNTGITDTLKLCVGGVTQTFVAATDASGNLTFTTGLPDGTYSYQVKGVRDLANSGTLTISGGSATVEFGTQRAGDGNNTNVVNAQDFTILRSQFGQSGPGLASDYNNDSTVNAQDFTLLRGNFGASGGAYTCP